MKAQNILPTLREAYNKELEKHDVLIMPTTKTTAHKLPPGHISTKGRLQ